MSLEQDLIALSRWTFASISSFVDGRKGSYNVWYQGQENPPTTWQAWAEVYMGGPRFRQPSHSMVIVEMEVMIGLMVKDSITDAHLPFRLRDQFFNMLSFGQIPCLRYGKDPTVDDQTLIGCYLLRTDLKHPVDGFDYANVDQATKLSRATIEGSYRMELFF